MIYMYSYYNGEKNIYCLLKFSLMIIKKLERRISNEGGGIPAIKRSEGTRSVSWAASVFSDSSSLNIKMLIVVLFVSGGKLISSKFLGLSVKSFSLSPSERLARSNPEPGGTPSIKSTSINISCSVMLPFPLVMYIG